MRELYDVIQTPVVTEKSAREMERIEQLGLFKKSSLFE